MNIYNIDYRIQQVFDNADFDEETGEIQLTDAQIQELQNLGLQREQIIEETCRYILNLEALQASLSERIKALTERRDKVKKKVASYKSKIAEMLNGQPRDYIDFQVKFTKSKSTVVEPEFIKWALDNARDLLTFKDPEPNKTQIKARINSGENIPYASIKDNSNMQIK